ncbi:MAG: ribosomal RNA small subunit methyltransferase A [Deltaproteobacteria bacterium]|nr:ribosomal RNA small subunit methyltransferase A [Deltaproteobacteria bacterium]
MARSGPIEQRTGLRPKKRLGQHFLVDHGIIEQIISRAGFQPSDMVLEIGPGQGALTFPLARSVGHVVAVEKDTRLAGLLEEKLSRAGIDNVTLVNEDILKWEFNELPNLSSEKIQVIGNLPYNISSPFLEKLIDNRNLVSRAVLMFQLEVARRLTASPGSKAYGAMTLMVRYHARPTAFFEVSAEAFFPRPKVNSMVLELDLERPYPRRAVHDADLKRVVKGAFAHRRKTVLNSLKGFFPSWNREMILEAMRKCGIDPGTRAETLDMDEFLCLGTALALTNE